MRGEAATIRQWLSPLPADLIGPARGCCWRRRNSRRSGHIEAVEPLLDAAERASADVAGEPFESTAGKAGSLLANVPALVALDRSYLARCTVTLEARPRSLPGPWPRAARMR